MIILTKCNYCGKEKPHNEMTKNRGIIRPKCYECNKKLNKKYYEKNKVKLHEHVKRNRNNRYNGYKITSFKAKFDLSTREGIDRYLDSIENG